ncbi:tail completion protein gp17 [Serratia ureilytica]|uniref:tail completion protein gp17 n=1 Tax=Serratia ureilytica TaxID=300181 RepID=UPI00313DA06F
MTEADLKSLLKPLVNGQAYPHVVKLTAEGHPAVKPPWIVYSLPSEDIAYVFCGPAETAITIQIDVYADTVDEATVIRNLAMEAVKPLAPSEMRTFKDYEPETALYRASFEFRVWR